MLDLDAADFDLAVAPPLVGIVKKRTPRAPSVVLTVSDVEMPLYQRATL
jgi:hypothetical protein